MSDEPKVIADMRWQSSADARDITLYVDDLRTRLDAAERERDAEYSVRNHIIHAIEGQGLPRVLPEHGHGVIQGAHALYVRMSAAERVAAALQTLVATQEQLAATAYAHWDTAKPTDSRIGKILGALAGSFTGYSLTLDAARAALAAASPTDPQICEYWKPIREGRIALPCDCGNNCDALPTTTEEG